MTLARIHCQVLEMPAREDWRPHTAIGRGQPRDLLPWADPYIAQLIHQLEDRFDVEDALAEPCDPLAPDDEDWQLAGAEWEDAFIPRSLDAPRRRWHPPVYGGFPLLEDGALTELAEDADADAN